jgi:glutamine synthetase
MHRSRHERDPARQGVAREQVRKSLADKTLRIPGSVFIVTVTGGYPEDVEHIVPDFDPDVFLVPDPSTLREAPGFKTPTAYVICDAYKADGKAVDIAPRQILKKVLALV